MLIPLPNDLEDALKLFQDKEFVDKQRSTDAENKALVDLAMLGIVTMGWVLTDAGKIRLKILQETQHAEVPKEAGDR